MNKADNGFQVTNGNKVFIDYVYVDHNRLEARVKTRVMDVEPVRPEDVPMSHASIWLLQDGEKPSMDTDRLHEKLINPVALFQDPFRLGHHKMALCEVLENSTTPIAWSHRHKLVETVERVKKFEVLMGFEQEYFLYGEGISTELYTDYKPGDYLGRVGVVKHIARQREIAEEHFNACITAGLNMYGYNREKANGQWEYQLGPSDPVTLSDHTVMARYLLRRVAEKHDAEVTFHPTPSGRSYPSSLHLNFSTNAMRGQGGLRVIEETLNSMSKLPQDKLLQHYDRYGGRVNAIRLNGKKHIPDVNWNVGYGAKVWAMRIPRQVLEEGCGHFEDRRPSSDSDPYEVSNTFIKFAILGEVS